MKRKTAKMKKKGTRAAKKPRPIDKHLFPMELLEKAGPSCPGAVDRLLEER